MHVDVRVPCDFCVACLSIKVDKSCPHCKVHYELLTCVLSHPIHPMHARVISHPRLPLCGMPSH